jgi:predicted methyltransferase
MRVATAFAAFVAIAGCQGVNSTGSIKPGINDHYRAADFDPEVWVTRFESESREIFQHRNRLVEIADLNPGMVVGDIGAGTGLFTPMFSKAVGPQGKVMAVDITPGFLELIRSRAEKSGLKNVETVLCPDDSVGLEPNSIDVAFVCDTYHHFEYPKATLASIHAALKPGGRLVIVDFLRIEGVTREWLLNHVRAGEETVKQEIADAGFALEPYQPDDSFLEENYVLRFRKPTSP